MAEAVTIVGGGLAGLTLGIGLRQRDVPVAVWEAGSYPRHRVCGEFISGRGQESLKRLNIYPELRNESAHGFANTVAFYSGKRKVPPRSLPEPALSISRYVLDEFLANEFQKLGGELYTGERWLDGYGEGIVRANGRRVETTADGWRLFGLKIHARGVRLAADLEMHFLRDGYVGASRLPDGEVNICGLFRSKTTVPDLSHRWRDWLGGPADSRIHNHIADAELDEKSFCAVAGFSLRPQYAMNFTECCVGDALTMIPPLTGNGMSMAFESAELAVDPLTKYSRGKLTWEQAQQRIAQACDAAFSRRLRWASWLQRILFHPQGRSILVFLTTRSERVWRSLFGNTR